MKRDEELAEHPYRLERNEQTARPQSERCGHQSV
jgi:hypothetical protein